MKCQTCGGELSGTDDAFCVHCGASVSGDAERPASAERVFEPIPLKGLFTVGAFLVIVVAIGAIAATLLGSVFHSPEPGPASGGSSAVTSTTAPAVLGDPNTPEFDPPLTEATIIEQPTIDQLGRYHLDGGAVLTFLIEGEFCGRGEGMVRASGTITNYSMSRQTFDYVLNIELIRAWNSARVGQFETTIERLAPFESAEWTVEMISSQVTTIKCNITGLTATPVGG